MRKGTYVRSTSETSVDASIDVSGTQTTSVSTGLRMFDHLLVQLAFHSGFGIHVAARSCDDIAHHLVEDTGIALGRALSDALGDRKGIDRYGSALVPMDDALVRVAMDLGGRSFARVHLPVSAERLEGLEVALVPHFLRSFAANAQMTLHLDLLAGEDPHHCIEAAFKACARSLRLACNRSNAQAPALSTKGVY